MKATGPCKTAWVPEKHVAWIRPNKEDEWAFVAVFDAITKRREKINADVLPVITIHLPERERTYKQNDTLWALITIIFQSMNGRKPTQTEKYDLYLDILEEHAERIPTRFSGRLRPIHISESDTVHAAQLIQACFDIIVEYCDLNVDLQSDVRSLFYKWHTWRGGLNRDPLDYDDESEEMSEKEWRENHKVSDASGIGGYLEKAHIVSRGASPASVNDVRNLIMLTPEEHRFQHQYGWVAFLERFPHLKGRILRARQLFGSPPLELRG
ncbi:MAG: hypothetical protein SAMD01599839_08230 [Rectinema sp.]